MFRLAILQVIILLNPCAPAIFSETCNLSDSRFWELNSLKEVDNLHWLWFYDRTFISRWSFYWMKWLIILFCSTVDNWIFVILSNTMQEIGYSKETIILLGRKKFKIISGHFIHTRPPSKCWIAIKKSHIQKEYLCVPFSLHVLYFSPMPQKL